MRKISKYVLSFLLFVVGTYGERIFNYIYTLLIRTPREVFTTFCVIASSIIIIYLTFKE